jgi:hypothetical protein
MPYLQPSFSGRELTVDAALKTPTKLAARIAKLTDANLLLPVFTHQLGQRISGGAMIFSTIAKENRYTERDVEQRGPGDEYPVTRAVPPTPHQSLVQDFGAKSIIPDEAIIRNDVPLLDQEITALSATLARKVDQLLMTKVEEAIAGLGGAGVIAGHNWSNVTLTGNTPTASSATPAADLALCQLAADVDDIGVKLDTLVVSPQENAALKIAYGSQLDEMLKSAGIDEVVSNNRIVPGTAFVVQKSAVGTVGWEYGLTVEVLPDRERRRSIVQAFVVPAVGIDGPLYMKKLTGLAG